jgi:hypothetical protein
MEGAMDHEGGCRCGAVRYRVQGEPEVVGLCHCADCRKETGGLYLAYADWPIGRFSVTGRYETWKGRSFCPVCGSRLFHLSETEAEILMGSLDAAPVGLRPSREIWVRRREPWLAPIEGAAQFSEDGD